MEVKIRGEGVGIGEVINRSTEFIIIQLVGEVMRNIKREEWRETKGGRRRGRETT